jgi:hypothetical protein
MARRPKCRVRKGKLQLKDGCIVDVMRRDPVSGRYELDREGPWEYYGPSRHNTDPMLVAENRMTEVELDGRPRHMKIKGTVPAIKFGGDILVPVKRYKKGRWNR